MDSQVLIDGLIYYLELIILLTLHEYGHAWTAWKCGDDTARLQGRVSVNPLVHIDPIGTVLLPLLMIFGPALMGSNTLTRFMVGYAKPVPVNPYNLNHPRRDDLLVTLAGPGMNLALAFVLVGLARLGMQIHAEDLAAECLQMASLSLVLCFFNLIPIPPLDGSQVMRVLTGMSYEAYANLARFGFFFVIIAVQLPPVKWYIAASTSMTLEYMARLFGIN